MRPFRPAVSTMLRDSPENRSGELNEAHRIFFSQSPYYHWESIKSPTLIIHDRQDTFVPFAHAGPRRKVPHANLCEFRVGGHILWLGRDARAMHQARVRFLRASHRLLAESSHHAANAGEDFSVLLLLRVQYLVELCVGRLANCHTLIGQPPQPLAKLRPQCGL